MGMTCAWKIIGRGAMDLFNSPALRSLGIPVHEDKSIKILFHSKSNLSYQKHLKELEKKVDESFNNI